jgi:hypothetical protein
MKKLKYQERRNFEDALWRETESTKSIKQILIKDYRWSARKAKRSSVLMLKMAIQYWAYEDVY